jgi:hypothetical protein
MGDANGCVKDDDIDGDGNKDEAAVLADRNANGDADTDGGDTAVEAQDSAPLATLADAASKPTGSGDNDGAAEVVVEGNEKENGDTSEGSVEATGTAAAAGASKN